MHEAVNEIRDRVEDLDNRSQALWTIGLFVLWAWILWSAREEIAAFLTRGVD